MNNSLNGSRQTVIEIGLLVEILPEIYQPIYQHPELSKGVSRICDDRLVHILEVYNSLQEKLGRQVRVLDLGCAQGFFSLHLAAIGAKVVGIDYLEENIKVCRALSEESKLQISFEEGRIEDVIDKLSSDEFDLVLGLSVFHHLIYDHGFELIRKLVKKLSEAISAGIFEIALCTEPLYWGPSQPENPFEMLSEFSFTRVLDQHKTHLSDIVRPLVFASNKFWFLDKFFGRFDEFNSSPHVFEQGVYRSTRKYFFGENKVIKVFKTVNNDLRDINRTEILNEIDFLLNPIAGFKAPELISHGENLTEIWLVRNLIEGDLLIDKLQSLDDVDSQKIIDTILNQLVVLEGSGLYHNDVRSWNVLLSKDGNATLIDYGSISKNKIDCAWPHDLLLSFILFVREVVGFAAINPGPIRCPMFDVNRLPCKYFNAFLAILSSKDKEFTFLELEKRIRFHDVEININDLDLVYGFSKLISIMEEGFLLYGEALSLANNNLIDEKKIVKQLEQRVISGEICAVALEERATFAELTLKRVEQRAFSAEKYYMELKQQVVDAQAYSSQLEKEVLNEKILNYSLAKSRSWKITKPLRIIGKYLRLLLGK